ncbi:MAG: GIY-YIG nuclease family protein [Candidatus Krumholzibacteriia bacterium]
MIDSWIVYILECADKTLYTGITRLMEKRLAAHQAGTASKYTRGRCPVRLVYQERQQGRSRALKREAAIKAMPRSRKRALIAAAVTSASKSARAG